MSVKRSAYDHFSYTATVFIYHLVNICIFYYFEKDLEGVCQYMKSACNAFCYRKVSMLIVHVLSELSLSIYWVLFVDERN